MKTYDQFLSENESLQDHKYKIGDWLAASGKYKMNFFYRNKIEGGMFSTQSTRDSYYYIVEILDSKNAWGKLKGDEVFYRCKVMYASEDSDKQIIVKSVYYDPNAKLHEIWIPQKALIKNPVVDKIRHAKVPAKSTEVEIPTKVSKTDRDRIGEVANINIAASLNEEKIIMKIKAQFGYNGIAYDIPLDDLVISKEIDFHHALKRISDRSGYSIDPWDEDTYSIKTYKLSIEGRTGVGKTIKIEIKLPSREKADQIGKTLVNKLNELHYISSQPLDVKVTENALRINFIESARIAALAKNIENAH